MGWMGRFLTAVAFLAVGVIFSPETFGAKPDGQHRYQPNLLSFLKLAHLLCFSVAFGAALWVTFIGGIIMFKYFLPPSLFSLSSCNLCLNTKGHSFLYLYFFKKNTMEEHSPTSSYCVGICRGINLGTCRGRCSQPTSLWLGFVALSAWHPLATCIPGRRPPLPKNTNSAFLLLLSLSTLAIFLCLRQWPSRSCLLLSLNNFLSLSLLILTHICSHHSSR